MSNPSRDYLLRQFDLAWKLLDFHLQGLATEECLWRPAARGMHVQQDADGMWRADWPGSESYDIGPPSIAWITWHIGFWWSLALDHAAGDAMLTREQITWPGDATAARNWILSLRERWRAMLEQLSDADLAATDRTRWPYSNRPFGDVVAWANVELTKNAAEIGYARFLYAAKNGASEQ
jgi:hypothetical protein